MCVRDGIGRMTSVEGLLGITVAMSQCKTAKAKKRESSNRECKLEQFGVLLYVVNHPLNRSLTFIYIVDKSCQKAIVQIMWS